VSELVVGGGRVLRPGGWVEADLVCRDGLIVETRAADGARRLDASGLLVAPGFVDLQCNGALGIDVTSQPDRLWELGAALPRWGVTAWLPTVVTAPAGAVDAARAALAAGPPAGWRGAVPLGLHLEGPFLAPARRGAHPEAHLRPPALTDIDGWSPEGGVALVTLAPELPGAEDVLAALVAAGVVVSIGHSDATTEQVRGALDAGASCVTHLFNAMAPLHHRDPGLVGVALRDARVHVGLIADGVHVAPDVVALAQQLLGPRLTLVTDAVAAAGTGDPAGVRLQDGTLAGSDLSMDQAVRNLVAFSGCAPEVALAAASTGPAAVLRDGTRGVLDPGRRADLVLLTPELEVVATVVGGTVVDDRSVPPTPHVAGA
jgi:N-acetylglucosamine-6-phosphate deacetylase